MNPLGHGIHQRGGTYEAEAQVREEAGHPDGRLEGGLIDVQVRAVDRLDLAGEGIGYGGCYSLGAGCARWAPHPPSWYGNRRSGDNQAVSAAERSSARNPHCIR